MKGCTYRNRWFILSLFGWLVMVLPAQAASFDCTKTVTKVEKLICANAELSKLDEELSSAYQTALQDKTQADSIRQTQKQRMKERNACSESVCLKHAYETRLSTLLAKQLAFNVVEEKRQNAAPQAGKQLYGYCVDVGIAGSCNTGQFAKTGKGYAVCETYLKHLNLLKEVPKCEAPVPPGFKQPIWEELEVLEHLQLAYQAEVIYFSERSSTQPDFETWRQQFLSELQAGNIAPQLRKTQVQPFGKKSITLLAYTRDRAGCENVAMHKDARWANNGYVYFLLADDPQKPLRAIDNRVTRTQSELLLYAGKPYFVMRYFESGDEIEIIAFDLKMTETSAEVATMDAFYAKQTPGTNRLIDTTKRFEPDPNVYWAGQLCHFSPVKPSTR